MRNLTVAGMWQPQHFLTTVVQEEFNPVLIKVTVWAILISWITG
jgi:hypothetical protein